MKRTPRTQPHTTIEAIQQRGKENVFAWIEHTPRGIIVSPDVSVNGRMYSLEAFLMAQRSTRSN